MLFEMRACLVAILLAITSISAEFIGSETKSLRRGDVLKPTSRPLRLIIMRFCPWCQRVLLALAHKNISIEVVNVNLSEKPKFLFEKHPDGKVPILEHNNKVILESGLIIEYLDWTNSTAPVLPNDPFLRAKQRMIAAQLEAKLPAAAYALINGQRFPEEKDSSMGMLHEALRAAEKLLTDTFYGGHEPGFADYMTYPFVERIWIWSHEPGVTNLPVEDFPSPLYPKLQRWFPLMKSRAEVVAASQPLWRHRLFNKGYVTGNPDYDAGLDLRRHH
ncbi:putative glutathione transferase omega-2 [Trichostrongylus colubriformis]|uniref:Glutathione S-transferase omega n=1 Tax=Trichostrongylus colubriformis TaxID=6319 RepID=A0AAN8EQ40_TRICO